jgi:hypothetical protein
VVILNEVKNLIITLCSKNKILRLAPQNAITTQSLDPGPIGSAFHPGNGFRIALPLPGIQCNPIPSPPLEGAEKISPCGRMVYFPNYPSAANPKRQALIFFFDIEAFQIYSRILKSDF